MRPTICGRATTTSHPSVTQTTGASQVGALCQTSFASTAISAPPHAAARSGTRQPGCTTSSPIGA